ncbi:MAG: hypothetical protein AAB544_02615 [Patescibacteria group bacterium]
MPGNEGFKEMPVIEGTEATMPAHLDMKAMEEELKAELGKLDIGS